jgi:hypothetical protein
MSLRKKNIRDLASLEKEIQRLRLEAKGMEKEMDDNLTYLQENYSSLVMNSVLPETGGYKGIPGTIIHLVLQHEKLREAISRLAEHLLDKVSDGLELITNKIFSKKE